MLYRFGCRCAKSIVRTAVLTIAIAGGLTTASARADALLPNAAAPAAANDAPPAIARFVPVARAAWPASPCAGREQIQVLTVQQLRQLVGDTGLNAPGAAADPQTCTVIFPSDQLHDDDPMDLCAEVVHEFGHLALGDEYFAKTNPSDPAHSPNRRSVMYFDGGEEPFAPCSEAVGRNELAQDAGFAVIDESSIPLDPTSTDCRAVSRSAAICIDRTGIRARVTVVGSRWEFRQLRRQPRARTTKTAPRRVGAGRRHRGR